MKIIAISDFHGVLPEITEKADVLFIAGDISPFNIQFNKPAVYDWLWNEFSNWIKNIPVEKVYLVPGNHDAVFQGMPKYKLNDLKMHTELKLYVLNHQTEYYIDDNGKSWSIFGTPYCSLYGNWPFMVDDFILKQKFSTIPQDVDFIITHDPPYGIGIIDAFDFDVYNGSYNHRGNKPLVEQLKKTNFNWLFCGHIHGGDHNPVTWGDSHLVNVSLMDEQMKLTHKPFIININ